MIQSTCGGGSPHDCCERQKKENFNLIKKIRYLWYVLPLFFLWPYSIVVPPFCNGVSLAVWDESVVVFVGRMAFVLSLSQPIIGAGNKNVPCVPTASCRRGGRKTDSECNNNNNMIPTIFLFFYRTRKSLFCIGAIIIVWAAWSWLTTGKRQIKNGIERQKWDESLVVHSLVPYLFLASWRPNQWANEY